MISALNNGISGLDSFQKALNVESHNISNVNTVGFKSDRISFADMMYQDKIGKGVASQTVQKDFSNGSYKQTGNAYDVAIEGNGFFIVTDAYTGGTFYTKAGDFKQHVDGKLVTSGGNYVQGVNATVTGDMIDNNIYNQFIASKVIESKDEVQTINTKASNYNQSAQPEIDSISGRTTKTAGAIVADIEVLQENYINKLNAYSMNQVVGTAPTNQTMAVAFTDFATQLTSSDDVVSVYLDNKKITQVFKDDAQTTMQLLAEKISSQERIKNASFDETTGALNIQTLTPGKNLSLSGALINENIYVITNIEAIAGSGLADLDASYTALEEATTRANAQITQVKTSVSKLAQDNQALNIGGLDDLQLNLTQLGISDNQFSSPEIVNGIIYMVQGDNRYAVGRIQTAGFADVLSLDPQGGNLFSATNRSGEALDATTSSKLVGKTLELSNSDLAENLVNLMVFQRAYEANSKSITTSDEFLSIAIQLKK
ncbi:MAG: flagellar hook-basal body complex protein [Arcobacteraceae bacterium]